MSAFQLHLSYRRALEEDAAAGLAEQLPRLSNGRGATPLEQWLAQPLAQVEAGPGKVPLSLAHKRLCGLLLLPLACQWLLDGQLPDLSPCRLSLDPGQGHAEDGRGSGIAALQTLVHAINRHFRGHKLPPRIIASNSAVYLAAPWTRLGMALPEPARFEAPARQWMALFGDDIAGAIDWAHFHWPDRQLLLPHRKDCCLRYKVCNGELCGTCNRYSREQMAANLRQWLDNQITTG
ncbi:hypothetical protein C7I36_05450 [Zobellella taiwanensis]|uniref:Ferric siderophore reductase C-terminal domain-containing protein n=1 Tax=Zobellella taiwanensis TaxID=347535 RepID=A0A2P7R5L4_9GAMM|nr:(2Fe-2S)-binding protein [Zobellella taiwanensis]PSJ45509.1 hypothetical protein C7I36_05450 [Zobellella taiwanensis]